MSSSKPSRLGTEDAPKNARGAGFELGNGVLLNPEPETLNPKP